MGKKIKVVLDTNVWVSIFMKKTLGREFSRIFKRKEAEFCISKDILKEISRVLVCPKIKNLLEASGVRIEDVIDLILENSTIVRPKRELNIIKEDPHDNRILECALESNATFVVSGDRHLLKLKEYKNLRIITPRQLFEYLKGR
jgi:hypothetical protein